MKVVIAAGGTGGHIYPAIAIINKIKEKEPDSEIVFFGTNRGLENDLVPRAGYKLKRIEAYGLKKEFSIQNIKHIIQTFNSRKEVKKFIDEIIDNLEIPIEIKNQKIIIEGNKDVSFIGDYKWQQEAITNIIKNAIEHNKKNGKITIKYEENVLFTKITIIDEGQGIAKEDLKHIFERFYKAQNSSDNSVGIGLSLAKNIIEKNNGMINCKSEIGNGTEFIVKYMK